MAYTLPKEGEGQLKKLSRHIASWKNIFLKEVEASMFDRVVMLQTMLVETATGSGLDDTLYQEIRKELMEDPELEGLIPDFVRKYRSGGALWGYFKSVSSQWQPRREHIWIAFGPLLDYLESRNRAPADTVISDTLASFDPEGVHKAWEKALDRRHSDPEGAITTARTLLEAVCKRILEECGGSYRENDDLPKLYHEVARYGLHPCEHSTAKVNISKQVLYTRAE